MTSVKDDIGNAWLAWTREIEWEFVHSDQLNSYELWNLWEISTCSSMVVNHNHDNNALNVRARVCKTVVDLYRQQLIKSSKSIASDSSLIAYIQQLWTSDWIIQAKNVSNGATLCDVLRSDHQWNEWYQQHASQIPVLPTATWNKSGSSTLTLTGSCDTDMEKNMLLPHEITWLSMIPANVEPLSNVCQVHICACNVRQKQESVQNLEHTLHTIFHHMTMPCRRVGALRFTCAACQNTIWIGVRYTDDGKCFRFLVPTVSSNMSSKQIFNTVQLIPIYFAHTFFHIIALAFCHRYKCQMLQNAEVWKE